jgi:hypothetical protein
LKLFLRSKKRNGKIAPTGLPSRLRSVSQLVNWCGKLPMDTIPLLPDFLEFLKFLSEEKVEYMVVGGMAVNYYGYHRSTGDLDIWVAVDSANQERLAAALIKFGFSGQSVSQRPLLQKPKFIRIGEPPLRLEIHSEISGVEFESCYSRARSAVLEGIEVRFIGLQDLRANKLAAGRIKDQADLESLPEV